MNKQRLLDIANNTATVNENDISEVKQLIEKYPYYALPHIVLAKIFFEKEHYLFENALTQAAMRVPDREWLYHFVHGDTVIGQIQKDWIYSSNSKATDGRDSIELETTGDSTPDIEIDLHSEVDLNNEKKNDLSDFLEDNSQSRNDSELSSESDEKSLHDFKEEVSETLEQVETPESEEIIEAEESIIEQDPFVSESEEELTEEKTGDYQDDAATMNIALNLRKHPVYNVEEFLQTNLEKQNEEASTEKDFFYWLKHPKITEEVVSHEINAEEAEPVKEHKLSIIDQFIKSNPGISRPKKEFFNAENMAKKSEYLDLEFVSETLANIYYEQGNIDLAIKAYEKLSLQNPQKQTYFATLIEKIKKEKR